MVVFLVLFLFSSSYHLTGKLIETVSNKVHWVRSICLVLCVMSGRGVVVFFLGVWGFCLFVLKINNPLHSAYIPKVNMVSAFFCAPVFVMKMA